MSDDTLSNNERRNFHRVIFDAPITLTQGDQQWQAQLIDISLKGALVSQPDGFPAQSGVETQIDIQFNDVEQPVTMQTAVAHVEDEHIGLNCHHIDMESITFLRRLLELNLGDDKLLERDLQALSKSNPIQPEE